MKNPFGVFSSISIITDYKDIIVIISISDSLEKSYFLLDQLLIEQKSKMEFYDDKEKRFVSLRKGKRDLFFEESLCLFLTTDTIITLKKLISDVLLNKAFKGYHFDLSLNSNHQNNIDVCFELS